MYNRSYNNDSQTLNLIMARAASPAVERATINHLKSAAGAENLKSKRGAHRGRIIAHEFVEAAISATCRVIVAGPRKYGMYLRCLHRLRNRLRAAKVVCIGNFTTRCWRVSYIFTKLKGVRAEAIKKKGV